MAQLTVRRIEDRVVRALRSTAARLGVSMEEAHRQLLRKTLLGESEPPPSFKEYLRLMPEGGPDPIFQRKRTGSERKVEL